MIKDALQYSDEQLVALVVTGKTDYFGVIYDRYSQKVYRKCIGFVRDRALAQDLVQDIFTKLFFQLSKFHGKSRFSTWLYAVTYNHCIEYLRKNNRYQTVDIEDEADIREDLSEEALMSTQQELLRRALDQIGPEDRMVLLMKYQDDMSVQEIMEVLEVGESAVKMRLARARQRVKTILETKEDFYA